MYALRITTDSLALRAGIPHFTDADFEELERILSELEDAERRDAPHRRFHQLLTSSGGPRLARSSAQLFDHAERYRRAYLSHEPADSAIADREHRAILDACRERDVDGAIEQLARHLSRTVLTVLATYAPTHDPLLVRAALVAVSRESDVAGGSAS
ncbi:MAG: FCD domain-containing protein [Solirubrobacteraceae bacterium]